MLGIPDFLIDKQSPKTAIRRGGVSQNIALISGDLAEKSTLNNIEQRFKTESLANPAIILFTPAGGMSYLPQTIEFYAQFINWMVNFADKRSCLILGEFPKELSYFLPRLLEDAFPRFYSTIDKNSTGIGYFLLTK